VWYVVGALASMIIPLAVTMYGFLYGDDGTGGAVHSSGTSLDSSSDNLPTNATVFTS
jgi:hypothetical protein